MMEGRHHRIRQVVVVAPSAFTVANLFFGFWAIISAARGDFSAAGWFIVISGVLDMLDGRIARMSGTGTRFGAELDSLVDLVSFGVAPAVMMYFLEFATAGRFAWILCFLYVTAVALRLARFNVMAADGVPVPGWFTGLPSPAAGMTLAVYYPWSQTRWYQASLAYLDLQHQGLVVLLLLVSVLMISGVRYPKWPRIGFRTPRGLVGLGVHAGILAGAIFFKAAFLFPLGLLYIVLGALRYVALGMLDRSELARWRRPPPPTDQEEPT